MWGTPLNTENDIYQSTFLDSRVEVEKTTTPNSTMSVIQTPVSFRDGIHEMVVNASRSGPLDDDVASSLISHYRYYSTETMLRAALFHHVSGEMTPEDLTARILRFEYMNDDEQLRSALARILFA